MSGLLVTKCICHSISFEDIQKAAEENGLSTIEDLQKNQLCSTKCKMCKPYVEMMLETGKTAFEPGEYLNTG